VLHASGTVWPGTGPSGNCRADGAVGRESLTIPLFFAFVVYLLGALLLTALLLPVLTAIVVVVVLVVCLRQARKWWLAWRRRSRPASGRT